MPVPLDQGMRVRESRKDRQVFYAMQIKFENFVETFLCVVYFIIFKRFEDVVSIHEIGEHFELDKIYHTHDSYTRLTRCV